MPEEVVADTQTADEALDQAIETAVADSDTPPEPQAEPSADDGQPRDEQGRFAGTPEDVEPAVEPTADPDQPPPDPTTAPPTETVEPFRYRADGAFHEIPGSQVRDDGVYLPKDAVPTITRLLASGKVYQPHQQRWAADLERHRARADAAEAQTQQVFSVIEKHMEAGTIEDLLTGWADQWPILKARAEAEGLKRQYTAEHEELERIRQDQAALALKPQMDQAVEAALTEFGTDLPREDLVELYERLSSPAWQQVVFVRMPYDDPATGLRKGELALNRDVIQQEVRARQTLLSRLRPAEQPTKEKPAPKKPPPTVSAKRGVAPTPTVQRPKFESTEEVDEWFDSGGYNELS